MQLSKYGILFITKLLIDAITICISFVILIYGYGNPMVPSIGGYLEFPLFSLRYDH